MLLYCSYIQHAKDLMTAAETRGSSQFIFQDMQKKIVAALKDAEKDNDFIYHAKIPELSSLTPIAKAPIAKSTPLNSPMSQQFKGLFDNHNHYQNLGCEQN